MDRERRPRRDDEEDDDPTEAILAADDTGLVHGEIEIVRAEIAADEALPDTTRR